MHFNRQFTFLQKNRKKASQKLLKSKDVAILATVFERAAENSGSPMEICSLRFGRQLDFWDLNINIFYYGRYSTFISKGR